MPETSAFLECQCGACRITLCDPNPRAHTECLCCDCRQRLLIYSKRSGQALPEAVVAYQRGVDVLYFANALVLDDASHSRLAFAKLREDGTITMAWSTCCGTLMCVTHPITEGASIAVMPDGCKVTTPSRMAPQLYLFSDDFPVDKYAALPLRHAIPTLVSGSEGMDSAPVVALLTALRAPLAAQYTSTDYTTFDQLCAGQPITIDDSCFDESRAGKPPTTAA